MSEESLSERAQIEQGQVPKELDIDDLTNKLNEV